MGEAWSPDYQKMSGWLAMRNMVGCIREQVTRRVTTAMLDRVGEPKQMTYLRQKLNDVRQNEGRAVDKTLQKVEWRSCRHMDQKMLCLSHCE